MKLRKMLCLLVIILAVLMFLVSTSPVRAEDYSEEEEVTRTGSFLPYYDPYGFYGIPNIYSWQYPTSLYGGYNPWGYGMNLFGAQNLYYPINLQGTGFVFQYPYMQIAPYIGATTFWQDQFPNADWSRILAGQFLGLINLPGLPSLF
ncbi:MAG: hypothetical protein ACMUIM_11945 [bacterium]